MATGSKPFHEAIVDAVSEIDMPSLEAFKFVLLSFAKLTRACEIPANHDAIANAFRERMEVLLTHKMLGVSDSMSILFDHIAAEKARWAPNPAALEDGDGLGCCHCCPGDWEMQEEATGRQAD